MGLSRLFFIFLLVLFAQSTSAQQSGDNDDSSNKGNTGELFATVNSQLEKYYGKGIEMAADSTFHENLFTYLMKTYQYDYSKAAANNDSILTHYIDRCITKEDIKKISSDAVGLYKIKEDAASYERFLINGLAEHNDSLNEPISSNGAIAQAIHMSSEQMLDLRQQVTRYIIGFVIFGIVFHIVFTMMIRLKGRRKDNKKSNGTMFIFIEIAACVIIIVILTLLVSNRCREFRANTTKFLTEAYTGALGYRPDFSKAYIMPDDDYASKDTAAVHAQEISSNEFRTMLKNTGYKTLYVERYGFGIRYPEIFSERRFSYNGDGCSMKDKWNTACLETSGMWTPDEWTIDTIFNIKDEDVAKITYSRIDRKKRYYIKSGYKKNGNVFYDKYCICKYQDLEMTVSARIEYPRKYMRDFEPIIRNVFARFPILADSTLE